MKCDEHSAIVITYVLEGGIQKEYHDNPGVSYRGDRREAYLPDTPEGNKLLQRLIYSFCHGLTFRVGTSITTGKSNQITWASIHHKTSLDGGPYGFPDPSYFYNANEELDHLGVPRY
jgi:deltex-like protein